MTSCPSSNSEDEESNIGESSGDESSVDGPGIVDSCESDSDSESDPSSPRGLYDKIARLDSQDRSSAVSGGRGVFDSQKKYESDDVDRQLYEDALAIRQGVDTWHHLVEVRILAQRYLNQVDMLSNSIEEEEKQDGKKKTKKKRREEKQIKKILEVAGESLEMLTELRGILMKDSGNLKEGDNDGDANARLRDSHTADVSVWSETLGSIQADLLLRSGRSVGRQSSNSFRPSAVDGGIWEQVEATVAHDRLMRGRSNDGSDEGPGSIIRSFDDSRAYQQLLKDFLASRATADATAIPSSSIAVRAAEDATANGKKKKRKGLKVADDVDRRASKGRKIRYVEHPKLTNYCFPIPRSEPAVAEDVWFKSLFGGASGRN
mmetsp:Transcript_9764/g.21742  ORF Transcript_9764/g.21742 Transcript_9764/m.21742 type:complete len:376 (-) Transcript_9764:728-1855(-)